MLSGSTKPEIHADLWVTTRPINGGPAGHEHTYPKNQAAPRDGARPFGWTIAARRSSNRDRLRSATRSLELANDLTLDRINDRKALLTGLDRLPRRLDAKRAQDSLDPFAKLAMELVTSGRARRAFDLNEESAATRERYGFHRWGQMALLARRLVESGVTFVTLNTAPDCLRWDSRCAHSGIDTSPQRSKGPRQFLRGAVRSTAQL